MVLLAQDKGRSATVKMRHAFAEVVQAAVAKEQKAREDRTVLDASRVAQALKGSGLTLSENYMHDVIDQMRHALPHYSELQLRKVLEESGGDLGRAVGRERSQAARWFSASRVADTPPPTPANTPSPRRTSDASAASTGQSTEAARRSRRFSPPPDGFPPSRAGGGRVSFLEMEMM